jgi:hypothetical protein|tara:strand:+ start:15894 stop:16064 length:171 start_codon:yes stop_codon:yes gene_type:complete
MNYKDGKVLFKIYQKLMELRMVSYTDCYGVPQVMWNGRWYDYGDIMKLDKRLEVSV